MRSRLVLTRIFYLLIDVTASLALSLAFYWSLLRNSSIASFINNTFEQPLYFWPYVILTLAAIVLFGINAVLVVDQWRKYGPPRLRRQGGSGLGALVGVAASACPICGSFVLSLVGISGGLAAFPFQGLELKALSVVFLAVPVWLMLRERKNPPCENGICPIPRDHTFRSPDRPWLILLVATIAAFSIMGWNMFRTDPVFAAVFPNAPHSRIIVGADSCKQVNL